MTAISDLIIGIIILMGALLTVVTMIGLIRLPDTYTRSHAASKSATLGVLLILVGCLLFFWIKDGSINGQLLLGIVFVFITSPVAGHLLGRASYYSGSPLWKGTVRDDLKEKQKKRSMSE
ncbi:monovalent cation/H(+) antiporter subunit G [Priestia flexa]|uniref:monovalent cation/H(+) antiporter subunit G n=1 Tax=Priestia flexa TaxID=86664 RepID=UPI00095509D4|nr:monovalent cation/H(+) antiporter subunit G [Priestia flexa]MBY6086858.1 monovalent cation/H(+) antiporter subunit G [Priestia flexa]MCP1191038.1 monovalent cation/H(+) antiporter subunit G [Priestia flexa]SIQ07922.1 multisubunit sodium/proton antiporter, MrpG subunit [Priestia flexa]